MALNKPRTRFFQTCLGVFQGGGCRGAAFVGALMEAAERGVDFAAVAGASAGSIVAALVGAGASAEFLYQTLGSLDFRNLLTPPEAIQNTKSSLGTRLGLGLAGLFVPEAPKLWKYNGLYSSRGIEDWMNKKLQERYLRAGSSRPFQRLSFLVREGYRDMSSL